MTWFASSTLSSSIFPNLRKCQQLAHPSSRRWWHYRCRLQWTGSEVLYKAKKLIERVGEDYYVITEKYRNRSAYYPSLRPIRWEENVGERCCRTGRGRQQADRPAASSNQFKLWRARNAHIILACTLAHHYSSPKCQYDMLAPSMGKAYRHCLVRPNLTSVCTALRVYPTSQLRILTNSSRINYAE